jgi:hypothetical protein
MDAAVTALLVHIDRLRGFHRAGHVPPFGAVEQLFDMAADVRSAIASGAAPREVTATAPASPATVRVVLQAIDSQGRVVASTPMGAL